MASHRPPHEELVPLKAQEEGQGGPSGQLDAAGEAPLCRICLEGDVPGNLERPCSCAGSMQHCHHDCLQKWINEKGNRICEICKQPFAGAYADPPPPPARHPPFRQEQVVNVLGINYLLVADPATGTVTARRLGPAGLGDEEEGGESDWEEDEDGGVARRISPQLACVLSALLTLLCMMLIRHLMGMRPEGGDLPGSMGYPLAPQLPGAMVPAAQPGAESPGAAAEVAGSEGSSASTTGAALPVLPDGAGILSTDAAAAAAAGHYEAKDNFQDMSASLLLLWLLARLLVLIVPMGWLLAGGGRVLLYGRPPAEGGVQAPLPLAQRAAVAAAELQHHQQERELEAARRERREERREQRRQREGPRGRAAEVVREVELEEARVDGLLERLEAGVARAGSRGAGALAAAPPAGRD